MNRKSEILDGSAAFTHREDLLRAASQHILTVDADGHVLESRDTWQKYMEPGLRDHAIRIEKDRAAEAIVTPG